MTRHAVLISVDSIGIDPLGHARPESVYAESRFLFPGGRSGDLLPLTAAPRPGALVETDVIGEHERGAIECAITYTSIFSGQSAIDQHGLMRGLGMNEQLFRSLIAKDNLFRHFSKPCLANAIFPAHLVFFGSSYVEDVVPRFERKAVEERLTYHGLPVIFKGAEKNGFAELFTIAEINQNIFVHAARQANVPLRTWSDVRQGRALTASMTHELEADFLLSFFDQQPLPRYTAKEAAGVLVRIAQEHDFTFYKYQVTDLVSHTGRVDLARQVFAQVEDFIETILKDTDPKETVVAVTSDHGHLEQLSISHAHPKSKVPTWYFGPDPERVADGLRRPEAIFHALTSGR